MPCYARRTVALSIKGSDVSLLADALKDCNVHLSHGEVADVIRTGKIRFPVGQEHLANEINRAYASRAVAKAAARFGWQVRKTGQTRIRMERR